MNVDFTTGVIFLITVVGAAGGVWWRIEAAISKAKTEATTQASAASATANLAIAQLAEHKLHVAETYVTKAGLRETTEQVIAAVNSVKADVHGLNERIDRFFEHQIAPPARPTRRQG